MFYPNEEGHHCDGSGKGPADTWIIRNGHEMIHDDVGYYAMKIEGRDKRFKGFYGDPTTLKLGNDYYEDNYQLNLDNLSPSMFNSVELNKQNVTPDIFNDYNSSNNNYSSWNTKSYADPLGFSRTISSPEVPRWEPVEKQVFIPYLRENSSLGKGIDRSQFCMNPESF